MTTTLTDKAKDTLEQWHRAKPVFALMGEYSAGKSTLLNFLVEQDVAPTQVTATNLPPLWITYSDKPFCIGLQGDGTEVSVDLIDQTANLRESFVLLRLGVAADPLKECDIVDTPGISDPTLPKGALRFLTKYIDFVVWCTAANQAWRQTEKAAFLKLSKSVRDDSILLITRADKLRNEGEIEKVLRRVRNETKDLFREIWPIKTTKAAQISTDKRTSDPKGLWVTTGGFDAYEALNTSVEAATKACQARREQAVQKPAEPAPKSQKKAAPKPSPEPKSSAAKSAPKPSGKTSFEAYDLFVAKVMKMPQSEHFIDRIDGIGHISEHIESYTENQKSAIISCFDFDAGADLNLERLISQVEIEISRFSRNEWVTLT